jgi:hypothetical protein
VQREIPEVGAAPREGGLLLRLLQDERCEGWEKSFKLAPGRLLDERLLLGIPRPGAQPAALAAVCEQLAMPPQFLAAFRAGLADADTVHFGFEDGDSGLLYKVYLEHVRRLAQPGTAPVLLHLAYKWDPRDPERRAVARYVCHRGLDTDGILARLAACYGGSCGAAHELVSGVVRLAAGRASEPLMYLDVAEEGNPRRSFDINLHPAALRLRDIEVQLHALQRHYAVPASRFEQLLDMVRGEKLGHLSGGISRDGQEFVTLYHEARAP